MEQKLLSKIEDLFLVKKSSIKDISNILNISIQKIVFIITKYNLFSKRVSDEDLINLYNNEVSLKKLELVCGTSRQQISRRLKSLGINIINRQNISKFNENVFDQIDSEEKAYWLGFLYADGCVYITKKNNVNIYHFEISLKYSDINHLYKFADFINLDKSKVSISKTNYKNKYRCRICLANKHFVNQLINIGCIPKKSLILKFPNKDIIPTNLIRHFIRGYFDGDGCLSFCKYYNKVFPKISIVGTKEFLSETSNELSKYYNKVYWYKDSRWNGNTFSINFGNKDSYEIINYIYNNSSIYLERKYNRYLFFNNNCRSFQKWKELLTRENEESLC